MLAFARATEPRRAHVVTDGWNQNANENVYLFVFLILSNELEAISLGEREEKIHFAVLKLSMVVAVTVNITAVTIAATTSVCVEKNRKKKIWNVEIKSVIVYEHSVGFIGLFVKMQIGPGAP